MCIFQHFFVSVLISLIIVYSEFHGLEYCAVQYKTKSLVSKVFYDLILKQFLNNLQYAFIHTNSLKNKTLLYFKQKQTSTCKDRVLY